MDALTLDQLRVLVAVADAGSVSAAARRLRRTQSAVSYAVAQLEAQLEMQLLDRSGYRAALTPQGEVIVAEARAVEEKVGRLRSVAARLNNRRAETRLQVALDASMAPADVAQAFEPFATAFPATQLVLRAEAAMSVAQLVRTGAVDIGISLVPDTAPADLTVRPIGTVSLVPVCAPHHPLAALAAPVPLERIRQHRQLVLTERDPAAFRERGRGLAGGPDWRLADMPVRHAMLRAGLGWAQMPWDFVKQDVRDGTLRVLEIEGWHQPPLRVGVLLRAHEPLGVAGAWLLEHLAERAGSGERCPSPPDRIGPTSSVPTAKQKPVPRKPARRRGLS